MSWQKMKSWQHTLACLAVVVVIGQPQMLLAVEVAPPNIGQRMEVPRDIMLAEGGLLVGQLVNEQGAAMSMASVSLNSAGKEVARVTTDKTGNFRVKSLRGGVYSVEAKGHHGVLAYLDVSIDIEGDEIAPAVAAEWLAYMRLEE